MGPGRAGLGVSEPVANTGQRSPVRSRSSPTRRSPASDRNRPRYRAKPSSWQSPSVTRQRSPVRSRSPCSPQSSQASDRNRPGYRAKPNFRKYSSVTRQRSPARSRSLPTHRSPDYQVKQSSRRSPGTLRGGLPRTSQLLPLLSALWCAVGPRTCELRYIFMAFIAPAGRAKLLSRYSTGVSGWRQGTTTTGTTEFSTISQKNDYISTSFNKLD